MPVACNTMPRVPLTTGRGPSAETSSTSSCTADRLAARGEHFERRDDVERVEPVEQHDLCIHVDIVGKATASG